MHPDTHVLIKIMNNCLLNSSFIGQVGDAVDLDSLWHYAAQFTDEISIGPELVQLELNHYSVYDVTVEKFVKVRKLIKYTPKNADWRIIHFKDNRHLFVLADTSFELVRSGDSSEPNPVPAMHLGFDEAIRRDQRLWWKQDNWPAMWVRNDLRSGRDYTTVLGFSIPKNGPSYAIQLVTESGHFTANGLDVCCEKG